MGVGPAGLFTHWITAAVPGGGVFFFFFFFKYTRLTGENGKILTKAHGQACMLQDTYCIEENQI